MWKIVFIYGVILNSAVQSRIFECPVEWVTNNGFCYKFVAYPRQNFEQASFVCKEDGATLVSINSDEEHRFITGYLDTNDQRRDTWYTSGRVSMQVAGGIQWEGDSTFSQTLNFWLDPTDATRDGSRLVYKHNDVEFGWGVALQDTVLSFICEISQAEAYRIIEEDRGFDYGLDIADPNLIPRGPKFVEEPIDTTILGETSAVFLECISAATPQPQYTWYKVSENQRTALTPSSDSRYTFSNGRLTISNPSQKLADESDYQCSAENNQGKVLSGKVQLSFGSLEQFQNIAQSEVRSSALRGVTMTCPDIQAKPAKFYQWYKNTILTFVRPLLQDHIFISGNGKLYFSEVSSEDAGTYHCMATLTNIDGSPGKNYIGASQSPQRTSIGFRLVVTTGSANNYQPDIQDDFISVYPGNPQRGQNIQMECFAYGTGPLHYTWSRKGNKLPKGVTFQNHGRIMRIPDVSMEDQGTYNCFVESKKTKLTDTKDYTLRIEAKPYFTYPLKDQQVDMNSQLTWHCEASGNPQPTYQWYKNGELIQNQPGVIIVNGNTLRIVSVKESDNGMYQCAAENKYGQYFSTGQLRALEFKPSFTRYPLEKYVSAARGGNITYVCNPEAAPTPTYSWKKDGRDLGLSQGSVSGNLRMLMNGNLYIEGVRSADQGQYTCIVENSQGQAENSGYLSVIDKTTITRSPTNERVIINSTATMTCEGSHVPNMDMVYSWYFNDHLILFDENSHYRLGSGITRGYLYILNAQFIHAGEYKCEVATALDQASASAALNVLGPPGQPVGVYRDTRPNESLGKRQVKLLWTDGLTHGADVLYFVIEFYTNFDGNWRVLVSRLYVSDAVAQNSATTKKMAILSDLKPGATYFFRVKAMNRYGIGQPSKKTTGIAVDSDVPKKAPDNVGGGGGKVGDLTITWTPMPQEDLNGLDMGYTVYWRRTPVGSSDTKWELATINNNATGKYVTTVGDEVFYSDYQVKVQAFNRLGSGNMSKVVDVKSAEELPFGTPTNVFADSFNSTSLIVYWNPVTDDRQNVKGKLLGYKINYWRRYEDSEQGAPQNILSGQLDQGLIIGLEPDTWYTVNVQVFNGAGNGPKSEVFHQTTDRAAPQLYPTEIYIYSHSADSVKVSFRGVSTQNEEEPLQGYKIKYWRSQEDIRKSEDYDCEKRNYGIIEGIEPNRVYELRVYGYSQGGQGKMSSPSTLFTLGGSIRFDQTRTEILAGSSSISPYCMVILLCSLFSIIFINKS